MMKGKMMAVMRIRPSCPYVSLASIGCNGDRQFNL